MTELEIEAFQAICRHKNISKAAAELFVSQSSLSERLKTLEGELGCPLFLRGKGSRGVALTPEGQAFYELSVQYQQLVRKMRGVGETPREAKLRIGACESVGNYILPTVYEQFSLCCPHIRLELQDIWTDTACKMIRRGETDLAFVTECRIPKEITAIPFLAEPMVFVCSERSDYPETVRLDMLSFKDEVHIEWNDDLERWHQAVFGAGKDQRVRVAAVAHLPMFTAKPGSWAIVTHSVAKSMLERPGIRQCSMDFYVPDRMAYILFDRKTKDSESVVRFMDCLRQVLRDRQMPGLLL